MGALEWFKLGCVNCAGCTCLGRDNVNHCVEPKQNAVFDQGNYVWHWYAEMRMDGCILHFFF